MVTQPRHARWGALVGVAIVAAATGCRSPGPGPVRDASWADEARACLLTPAADWVAPAAIVSTAGEVTDAAAMLVEDGAGARLSYPPDGARPVAVLDLGRRSAGGYAVFTVTARTGLPVVRLAYACHPDGLSETGCFTRQTSARYLGEAVDLPVLPANIYRHETYTIPRTGRFIAPLIQGQTRYLRVQLDTPGTAVEIDAVWMVNREVHDRTPNDGLFLCSDDRLNRLWAISTWTLQIASLPNHDAWKTAGGWLLPRKLEMAGDVGLSRAGEKWRDVTVETTFELRANPDHVSAAGVAFRATDPANAYLAEVTLDGTVRILVRKDGRDARLYECRLPQPLVDGRRYRLRVQAIGPALTVCLDGERVAEASDATHPAGRVGFYTPKERWPLFDAIRVTDGRGRTLLADDFSGDLAHWQFARTRSFVADGAKRDRLVWSGDLYFAQRNAYYAWADPRYLRDSLKMLAFNQTPEGYVHASPYPERSTPPPVGDHGLFPSDEFAAWLPPVAWEHLLYTGDTDTLREIWPAIERLLGYLKARIGPDGLFRQERETSKHAGNLDLGDVRTRSYMNILLWGAFTDAARIARCLGHRQAEADAQRAAAAIHRALDTHLWDENRGFFVDARESPEFGAEANALALSMGLVSGEQARRIAPRFARIEHGKFQALASRGLFRYGFGRAGLDRLLEHNWLRLLDPQWQGAWTTTECMQMGTRGWGDESHPDTAIAGHLSAYLLGVIPVEPGYRRFAVRPHPLREVTWARGRVPTPHGDIAVAWDQAPGLFRLSVRVPPGTRADVALPPAGAVNVNGRPGRPTDLRPGNHVIEVQGLPAEAWDDPVRAAPG